MRTFSLLGALALTLTLGQACSSDSSHPLDGGAPAGDGAVPDGGLPTLEDAGPGEDAGDLGDAAVACAVGSSAEARFGPSGGHLALCGASVDLVQGVLAAPTRASLTIVELSQPVPFPLRQAGLAFALEVEGGVPAAVEPPLHVLVPHEATDHYLYFFRVADEYQGMEACTVNESVIGQAVGVDGVYVALADQDAFPNSRDSLGSGSVSTTFDGVDESFDLGSDENFDTYVIYNEDATGGRTYTLSATEPFGEDNTRVLRLTFSRDPDGAASVIEVTFGDFTGLWSYLPFGDAPAQITAALDASGKLSGTFEVELMLGEEKKTLTGSFEATGEKFRYPPELSCGGPIEG